MAHTMSPSELNLLIISVVTLVAIISLLGFLAWHEVSQMRSIDKRNARIQAILAGPDAVAALIARDPGFAQVLDAAEANLANVGPNRVW